MPIPKSKSEMKGMKKEEVIFHCLELQQFIKLMDYHGVNRLVQETGKLKEDFVDLQVENLKNEKENEKLKEENQKLTKKLKNIKEWIELSKDEKGLLNSYDLRAIESRLDTDSDSDYEED